MHQSRRRRVVYRKRIFALSKVLASVKKWAFDIRLHFYVLPARVFFFHAYGINLDFYYQSMGQLKRCCPDGQEHTLLSNTTQIFFGVNDNLTADYVSTRLGDETIVVQSFGTSSGRSTQWSHGMHPSHGGDTSSNESQNWQQMAWRLLKPEEVMALPARTAITFTPNMSPICTELIRYFEERQLGIKSDRIRLRYERRDLILSAIGAD